MKKLQKFIIHLLGGTTLEEDIKAGIMLMIYAEYKRIVRTRKYLDLLNGLDADDWCKSAYNYVCRVEKELNGRYDELGIGAALRKEDGNGAE